MVSAVLHCFGVVEREKEVKKVAEPPADDIQVKTRDLTEPLQNPLVVHLPGCLAALPAATAAPAPVESTAAPAPAEPAVPLLNTVPDFPAHLS